MATQPTSRGHRSEQEGLDTTAPVGRGGEPDGDTTSTRRIATSAKSWLRQSGWRTILAEGRQGNQPTSLYIAEGKGGWEAQRQRGGGPQATKGTRLSNTGNHTRQASKGGRGYPEPLTVYAGSESVVSRYPKRPFRDQGPQHACEHLLTVQVFQSETDTQASPTSRQPAATRPASTRRDAWGRSQLVQDISARGQRREE